MYPYDYSSMPAIGQQGGIMGYGFNPAQGFLPQPQQQTQVPMSQPPPGTQPAIPMPQVDQKQAPQQADPGSPIQQPASPMSQGQGGKGILGLLSMMGAI